ncbi:MAG: prolipoprotein diacylglyceryl transferase family protein [Bacteroidota bacterium]
MYPNLSYLLHDLFGTARDNATSVIQMFGLLLGAAFFVAAYILHIELRRKEKQGLLQGVTVQETVGAGPKWGEVIGNALFGLVVGLKVPGILQDFDVFQEDAAGYVFSAQGNWPLAILGALLFGGFSYWNGLKGKLDTPKTTSKLIMPSQRVGDITIIAAIFGLLGARLFSILENMDSFWQDPIGQLTSGSGLTIYGGLILAFVANYIYVKRHGINPIHVMDAIAPALIIGYGIGRMGCHFSGDGDWGIVNELAKPGWFVFPDWMWAYDYPNNVLNQGVAIEGCTDKYCRRLSPPVFPTPIYEIVVSFMIFLILWVLRKRVQIAGMIFFIYAILMSIERFLIEFIRVNPRYLGLELSQAQFISIGIFLVGVVGVVFLTKKPKAFV